MFRPGQKRPAGQTYGGTVKQVTKSIALLSLLVFALGATSFAQVTPTPFFTNFYDSTSTFNGSLLPVGSIVDAYDPDGIHCGTFTVQTLGHFGFMPVYGDDDQTAGIDEGANDGDVISFKLNGRDAAVVSGVDTWTNQTNKQVQLSVTTATVGLSFVNPFADGLVAPGRTFRLSAEVRNDGDGLDFFGVVADVDQPGWNVTIADTVFYADSNATATVYFDVTVPVFPGDTTGIVAIEVYSGLDTSVKILDTALLYVSITDVDDGDDGLPDGFALNQNYPNPFNPTTTISFSLAVASQVRLEVYDVLGRRVEVRELGRLSSGDHSVEFDGSQLASGVYLYRLITEDRSIARKMMLLK